MRRSVLLTLASLMASIAPAASAADMSTPEARWNAVASCGSRTDERARHACVDDVMRKAGVLGVEQERRDERQRFGRDPAPAVKSDEPDTMQLKIGTVTEGRDGSLTLTTEDGVMWRQTETRPAAQRPKAGQTLTVRKAMMGSFLCQVESTALFRCARSR